MKKFLTTLLAIGLVIAMPVLAVAATFTLLHQSPPIEWVDFENEVDTTTGPEIPHLEDSSDVFWHFIANQLTDEQSPILKATIIFKDAEGKEYTSIVNSYKTSGKKTDAEGKTNHYGIYTPFDYVLIGASVDAVIAGEFNLSHVATTPTTTETTVETTPTTTSTTVETTPTTTETTIETTPTTEATTTQTSGTTVESSTSITTTSTSPTTTLPEDFPKTGEVEDFQMTVIGATFLALAAALAIWRKRIKQ